jgi:hypothetical protein
VSNPGNTGYDKAYVLFNYSTTGRQTPVFVGFWDSSKSKILVNGSILAAGSAHGASELVSKIIDFSDATATTANGTVSYAFKLIYGNAGDQTFYLNMTASADAISPHLLMTSFAGKSATVASLTFAIQNKTEVTTSQAPTFQLGATPATNEAYEVNSTTHGTARSAGMKTQEIVDDSGLLLQATATYGASDQVVFKVPFKALNVTVYFGQKGEGVSGDTVECASYPSIPITSAIARLDSELTTADKNKNLIAVGGSCVNSVSADALGLDYPTCGADAADAFGISEGEGAIIVADSPYAEDVVVLLVAGWDVDNTRAACSAIQLFDTKLAGIEASSVVVTGSVGAPVVTEVA